MRQRKTSPVRSSEEISSELCLTTSSALRLALGIANDARGKKKYFLPLKISFLEKLRLLDLSPVSCYRMHRVIRGNVCSGVISLYQSKEAGICYCYSSALSLLHGKLRVALVLFKELAVFFLGLIC